MDLDHDKELPDSAEEAVLLPPSHPVRFVWDQTTKRSAHNARMKNRIVSDMIANRYLYPRVPEQEFTKAKLDSVFEQAYFTLRQKYASQKGLNANAKDRAEMKSKKARRLSRKKIKLANRSTTRKKLEDARYVILKDVTFDAAFQMDCMSSEESSEGEDASEDAAEGDRPHSSKSLRIRYLAWRSTRLQALFRIIDEHEQYNREMKPKRGSGRKDRRMGHPKEGNPPPPKGTPHWMVSKKWLREASAVNHLIADLVSPDNENAAQALSILGDESDDEEAQMVATDPNFTQLPAPPMPIPEPLMPTVTTDDAFHHAQFMYAQHAAWADTMAGYVDLSQYSSPVLQTYPPGIPHSS
ncbi:uncharacterized protein FOMMEDRAFT_90221 [Fomitiporia mediterranea MF3/22]|uniref:uncharacterized protein n=1 Tax=Fomitiporia mediterranea (strain MF3/22) TaxID=694068 RepID=UPI0004408BA9|nr:uncharacterized protein FOMMEDRAFT_90221 [Fomitiporia mediterranea MF3/22]EJD01407.1 hypothetical protein FOMMEDRAFT_90221 [Fomitiporia mediterranea MF3/22]